MKPDTTVYKSVAPPTDLATVTVDDAPLREEDGFEWRTPEGQLELAQAILFDYYGAEAQESALAQAFSEGVIAHLPYAWTITGKGIEIFMQTRIS